MEFTNEISFNKELVQDETVLITYTGKLYREHSQDVSIVFGFGQNWDYTTEIPMHETENGFEVFVELKKYDTFNFCFKNNYNIWDNNSNSNYIASVAPAKEAQDLTQNDVDIAFDNLLNSLIENISTEEIEVDLENGFGLQSVDEIKETDLENCDEALNELSSNDSIQKAEETESNSELEKLLNNISENQEEPESDISSELDNIMDNILNSIVEENSDTNSTETETAELPAVIEEESFFATLLMGFKKLGSLIKQTLSDLVGEK